MDLYGSLSPLHACMQYLLSIGVHAYAYGYLFQLHATMHACIQVAIHVVHKNLRPKVPKTTPGDPSGQQAAATPTPLIGIGGLPLSLPGGGFPQTGSTAEPPSGSGHSEEISQQARGAPEGWADLMTQCWHPDPSKRPHFHVSHSLFVIVVTRG